MSKGKRFRAVLEKVDRTKEYSLDEAISLVKETSQLKFDATIELHLHLGIDPKKGEQIVRSSVTLPHAAGKKRRIAAFVAADKEAETKAAGADLVGGVELVKQIQTTGKIDFDVALTTPDFMKNLAVVAKILGPKGLMPNPKNETITTNLAKTIGELAGGKQTFRSDDGGNVHGVVGKASFTPDQIKENFNTFLDAVKRAKPKDLKGTYIQSITLASTMGPGVRIKL